MNGGKTMWLIDQVSIDLDSLQNPEQTSIAYPLNLNLDDIASSGFTIELNKSC